MENNSPNNQRKIREQLPDLTASGINPFQVPAGYFDSLTDELMNKVAASDQFANAAPENKFLVPENYFEQLPLAIADRISSIGNSRSAGFTSIYHYFGKPVFRLAVASMCALLVTIYFYLEKEPEIKNPEYAFTVSELKESDLLFQLNESMLIDVIAKETNSRHASDEYEDYLIDNHLELNQIIEQL